MRTSGTPSASATERAVGIKPVHTIPTAGIPAASVQAVLRATAGVQVPHPPTVAMSASTLAALTTSLMLGSG
jgi:hypothetical protein